MHNSNYVRLFIDLFFGSIEQLFELFLFWPAEFGYYLCKKQFKIIAIRYPDYMMLLHFLLDLLAIAVVATGIAFRMLHVLRQILILFFLVVSFFEEATVPTTSKEHESRSAKIKAVAGNW